MRYLLALAFACGGGGKPAEKATPPRPAPTGECAVAYAEYEERWKAARSEELKEVDFDAAAIEEVVALEVALLPKKTDVEKLRDQYGAIAAFIPDAPWPLALDAADAAIDVCGEEARRPT